MEQLKWHQAATALNEILVDLGNAVRDGADDVANADRRAAGLWATVIAAMTLCGPDVGEPSGPHSPFLRLAIVIKSYGLNRSGLEKRDHRLYLLAVEHHGRPVG